MYAVVETGGKQVRVQAGDVVDVERIPGEIGDTIELDDVRLLVDGERVFADAASLEKAKVKAVIRAQDRDRKVISFLFRRRKKLRRKRGHRQSFTRLEVTEVTA
ncbi:MAG: 50S ribosomal protein L21 [bacterium]|nr:50S ribosomal protein L21 [bacterium]